MVAMRDWYARVNAAWPAELPELTDWEAVRAASRLYRWARGRACPLEIRATSGNRYTYARGGVLWVNPDKGWRGFIHELSHYVDLEPEGHSAHHARLELRMIREVLRRGWLDGRLRKEPAVKAKPERDPREVKRERIAAAMARWESKAKRAETALAKLRRRAKYYDRVLERTAA